MYPRLCRHMANEIEKVSTNVPGSFYVDVSCIDCDKCRSDVPEVFRRDDELAYSYVYRQPATEAEILRAQMALDECPTNSIGNDG